MIPFSTGEPYHLAGIDIVFYYNGGVALITDDWAAPLRVNNLSWIFYFKIPSVYDQVCGIPDIEAVISPGIDLIHSYSHRVARATSLP